MGEANYHKSSINSLGGTPSINRKLVDRTKSKVHPSIMFGWESCQDMRIYFGGHFCQRGHLHPLTNSKSEMMSHVGGGWCCNTWPELGHPPWKPSIGSSVVTWKKVSALNIFGQITVEGASSGVFRIHVSVQANWSSTSSGQTWKTEKPGFLAFCDPRAV